MKKLFYSDTIPATLLRDYIYCPMIPWIKIFYRYEEPATESMLKASIETDANYKEKIAEKYKLPKPWRIEVYLYDKETGLSGVADIIAGEKRAVVAEIKRFKREKYQHQRIQLLIYAYLTNKLIAPVEKAILIHEEKITLEIEITKQHLETIEKTAKRLRETIEKEEPPTTNPDQRKCIACQYRRICPKTEK